MAQLHYLGGSANPLSLFAQFFQPSIPSYLASTSPLLHFFPALPFANHQPFTLSFILHLLLLQCRILEIRVPAVGLGSVVSSRSESALFVVKTAKKVIELFKMLAECTSNLHFSIALK